MIFEIEENIIEGEKWANIKMDMQDENQIIILVILKQLVFQTMIINFLNNKIYLKSHLNFGMYLSFHVQF